MGKLENELNQLKITSKKEKDKLEKDYINKKMN